jgi:hypothetical protein
MRRNYREAIKEEMTWTIVAVLVGPTLLLQTIFVLLQVNHNIDWNWGIVFIPWWVLLTMWLYSIGLRIKKLATGKERMGETDAWNITLLCFFWVGISLFSAFLSVRLNGITVIPWPAVFSPLWALFLLYAVYGMARGLSTTPCGSAALWLITWSTLLVLSIEVAIQMARAPANRFSWSSALVPLWILMGTWLIALCISITRKVNSKCMASATQKPPPAWMTLIVAGILWAGFFTFAVLLNLRLVGPERIGIPALFSPLIVCFALVFYVPFSKYHSHLKKLASEHDTEWLMSSNVFPSGMAGEGIIEKEKDVTLSS